MGHLRRLAIQACAAVLGSVALALYVCLKSAPLTPAQLGALRAALPLMTAVLLAAGALVLRRLLEPLRGALRSDVQDERERRRTAVRALRLPARLSLSVLALGATYSAALVLVVVRAGLALDLAAAGAAVGVAFSLTSSMLAYAAAATNLAPALVELGPAEIRERGTVRGKVLMVGFGFIAVTALLLGSFAYSEFRLDADEAHVAAARHAVDGAARVLADAGPRQAVEALAVSGMSSSAVLDERGAPLAHSGDAERLGGVKPSGEAVEALEDGWLLRSSSPHGTLVAFTSDATLRARRHAFARSELFVILILAFTALVLVAGAARTITVPLEVIGSAANRIASGDLTVHPPNVTRDEMGQLASDFRRMAHGLAGLVLDVQSAARSVSDGARDATGIGWRVRDGAIEEHQRFVAVAEAVEAMQGSVSLVGRGVDSLADYVASTSAAVSEMAAALDEIGRQGQELERLMTGANVEVERLSQAGRRTQAKLAALDDMATHANGSLSAVSSSLAQLQGAADDSQTTAESVAELADASGSVVEEAVAGIETLRQAVDDAKRRVTVLGRRSDDIDQILDFIGEVAGRTNLLSLNASIIATQAGEHGKAFGVVAEQIRELASQIASSTKSIGEIIRAVRDDVSGTARLIDRGDALAAQGVALARKSLGALQEIRGATARARDTSAAIQLAVQAHTKASGAVADLVGSVAENSRAVGEAIQMVGRSAAAVGQVGRGVGTLADRVTRALEEQSGVGRQQLESLEHINSMLAEITTAVDAHEAATRRVRELLDQLDRTARAHESAVAELSGVADRLGGRSRDLAERVDRFKI